MRYLFICALALFICACGGDELTQREQIDQYIAENNIMNLDSLSTGLYYVINTPGGDEKPDVSNTINISYDGYYIDEERFDGNANATFPLSNLIIGWQQGIPLIGRGGSIKLIIPPNLAYGPNPQNGIRSNAVLVFDIELFDF